MNEKHRQTKEPRPKELDRPKVVSQVPSCMAWENCMKKFPNQTVERLTALRGILNMHERAIKAKRACKLNGVSRKWDMGTWDCGTAACALGSAGLNPWFKERGLETDTELQEVFFRLKDGTMESECHAGAAFFGITLDESMYLFSVWNYDSFNEKAKHKGIPPSMVRTRVDELISKYSGVSHA